jgi:hypothetical protein
MGGMTVGRPDGPPVWMSIQDTNDIMHGQARGDASDYVKKMAAQRAQQLAAGKTVKYGPDGKPIADAGGDGAKKGAGPAPDYKGAAEDTSKSSQAAINAQTQANRPNTSTPFGTTQWTQGPDGSWQMNTGFSGGLGNAASSLNNQAGQSLSNPLDFNGLAPVGTGDSARQQATGSAFDYAMSRLNPRFAKEDTLQRSRLANQGIDPMSLAGRNAATELGRNQNDATMGALSTAIDKGTSAGNSLFQNNLAGRQQGIDEILRARTQPIQDMSQLQGLLNMPSFNTAGAATPTNYYQATTDAGNWNLQDKQMQNAFWSDLMGSITSMVGAGASMAAKSDERLKQNIHRLNIEALPGVPFATWEWKAAPGKTYVGVIAQDLEKVAPEYVSQDADGIRWVDYSFLIPKQESVHG